MNVMRFKRKPLLLMAVLWVILVALSVRTLTKFSFLHHKFSSADPSIEILEDDPEVNDVTLQEDRGNNNMACQHPILPLHNPDIDQFFEDVPPLRCDLEKEDWVRTDKSTAKVTDKAKSMYEPISCTFTELLRQDEFNTISGESMTLGQDEVYTFSNTDYVEVTCKGRGRSEWKSFLAAPRESLQVKKEEKPGTKKPNHPSLNVLIWGQDSVSRLMFIRKLPRTWKYIKNTLKGIVLKGYNIVGDGTPQALTPILTGQTELELPEARAEMGDKANFVDVYPFIWNEYKKSGYLTGFMEDQPTTATFSHRHKGFKETPTDFYMRTFFLAVDAFLYPILTKVFSYMWPNYCIANTATHKVMMDYFTNILRAYEHTPKFLFTFRSEQSHNDVNAIQGADEDLEKFLQTINGMGTFNNSIVILMSDHGARFQAIRESQQGKMEERLPAWIIFLPPWFAQIYPTADANFRKNGRRLVTPFDIYRTLQDIHRLGTELTDEDFREKNPLTQRGMSLFREIPPSRTCAHADIEPHWCACLKEEQLSVDDKLVQRAANEFIQMVNQLTEPHRLLCIPRQLSSILSAVRLIPSAEFLKFRKSSDRDGRVPQMADDTDITNMILQLKVETSPGEGRFEVTMDYDRYKGKFLVKETDISRINKYGSQADCVAHKKELSYLRKYCYCRDQKEV